MRMKSSDWYYFARGPAVRTTSDVSANIFDLVTRLTPLSRVNVSANKRLTESECER
ncbi:hypothetical protein MHPYR_30003 [uncultured Mycobacterium sp.]|uniref:Uncharacterized protein n=1 Tax=uncultured Mycobacterium sp. TaxID=171292 RepID=A0A1Y5PBB9_9MYCO|nr:hypothetical protein MHPYR_30003 [uncultured Mycobacterium sp.]